MASAAPSWPPELAGTPAAAVIERALERRRLGHSLLLHGGDPELLAAFARSLAERLLAEGGPSRPAARSIEDHPDCFVLRPAGKARIISADAVRDLLAKVQVTPAVALRKVAILHEADRLNTVASNILLKTLEEPPADTTLLLLTSHPYSLLPTIRSRCLHFRLPAAAGGKEPAEGWNAWLQDYRAWLGRLAEGVADKAAAADALLTVYGLIARFGALLASATEAAWAGQKENLAPDMADEEQVAIEAGIAAGLRARLFAEIESATREFARPRVAAGDREAARAFADAIGKLEGIARLLRVNLNESTALEDFLLGSLRLWSKR